MGSLATGAEAALADNTKYPSEPFDGEYWYKLKNGYYVRVNHGTYFEKQTGDTRKWHGDDGRPGVVILEG